MVNNVEIIIKGVGTLDIDTKASEEFGIPVIYNIDDVNNFGKRKTNYTKTIKVPATKNNNRIFGQIYDIKNSATFDMRSKHQCVLLVNKQRIIDGYLTLNEIDKYLVGDKYQVYYNINIYGELKTLFDSIGEKKLTDLDFSSGFTLKTYDYDGNIENSTWTKGNHVYNEQSLIDSYATKYPYFYPVTDYGYDLYKYDFLMPFFSGYTIITGQTNYNYPYDSICLGTVYPSLYVKAIIDKIFYEAGWTYTSNFISGDSYDDIFGNLVTICNKPKKIVNKNYCSYVAYNDNGLNYPGTNDENFLTFAKVNGIFSGETYNYYEIDDFYFNGYKVLEGFHSGGTFILSGDTELHWKRLYSVNVMNNGFYTININMGVYKDEGGYVELPDCAAYLPTPKESEYNFFKYTESTKKCELIRLYSYDTASITTSDIGGPYYNTFDPLNYKVSFTGVELKKGDMIFCQIVPGEKVYYSSMAGTCVLGHSEIWLQFMSIELVEENKDDNFINEYNKEINISRFLPEMKQVDFLKEIVKMFNLHLYTKYNNVYNNVIIEPRDDFYNSMVNWTDKVDYSEPINISNLNDKNFAIVNLTYTEPEDYLSKDYKKIHDKIYGSHKIYNDSNLFGDETVLDLQFQSYLTQYSKFTDYDIPCLTEKLETTWYDSSKEYKPMIGFKHIEITDVDRILKLANFNNDYPPLGVPSTQFRYNQYIYIPISNYYYPFVPTVNFVETIGGTEYSLEFTGNTQNNLYNLFYRNQIDNLQHKDCRYVTYYLNLTFADILSLDFRNKVLIDGQLYILQKIEYDVTKIKSSKVELLKVVAPWEEGVIGAPEFLSIQHFNGSDDYFQPQDPDRIKIS